MSEALATTNSISDSSEFCVAQSAYQDLLSGGYQEGLDLGRAAEIGLGVVFSSEPHRADSVEIYSGPLANRLRQVAVVSEPQDLWIDCPRGAVDHVKPHSLISGPQEDWMEFRRLVGQWKTERGVLSSITQSALCPAYQSIIGMGRRAVPLILRQLKSERNDPDQWFWALQVITGDQPVKDEDRGNYVKMAQAWLDWGISEDNDW